MELPSVTSPCISISALVPAAKGLSKGGGVEVRTLVKENFGTSSII